MLRSSVILLDSGACSVASALIELRDVSLSFGQEQLLTKINLKISQNECFVLIGPSGQGKSMLLKIMAGICPPSTGQVLVNSEDLYALPELRRHQLMRQMGMLFQKNALFDSLSVAENIAFPLREVAHLPEAEISARIEYFLSAVQILHAKELFPDEISGGMQKRLGIARALALKPEIILYDDPTAGLDPITSRLIIELIIRLKKENNSTVIAITNDMNRAYQMADRIAMVVDKEVILTGSISETKKHQDPRVRQFISGQLEGPLTELA